MSRRVVITGMGGVTALGQDWLTVEKKLREGENAVRYMENYALYEGLNTKLAAPITDFEVPKHYTRKQLRAMGRVSKLATVASEKALTQAVL